MCGQRTAVQREFITKFDLAKNQKKNNKKKPNEKMNYTLVMKVKSTPADIFASCSFY